MSIVGIIIVSLVGLMFGSFAGATVWRLRARQLIADKKAGEPVSGKELKRLKPLVATKLASDRSRCLHCQHELAWYDLLPLISWLSTKGKCRYCHRPIGWFEPLIELGSALLFVSFFLYFVHMYGLAMWPLLLVWVPILVMFVILFAYDLKWFILPDVIVFPLIGLSAIIAGYAITMSANPLTAAASAFGAVVILGGLYFALWLVSRGTWVGFGDVKLGVALGLLLADWKLAFLALFLANLIGTLIVLPGLITKRIGRKASVPFGPLLIIGFFLALFLGDGLIEAYIDLTNSLI